MLMRAARLVALDQMCAWADAGEHESAGPNRSPLIDRINRAAGVPLGSPYCASAAHAAFVAAGITDFGGPHFPSVGQVQEWASQRGYLVSGKPTRGDGFCWQLDGDSWPDHFGMVLRVRSWGGLLFTVDTVEANTSASSAGSQDDGGGWHYRHRTFTRGRVRFVRDPRQALLDPFAHGRPVAPKRIPRWAWQLNRWYAERPAARGPRPGPRKPPGWFWPWRAWISNPKGASK